MRAPTKRPGAASPARAPAPDSVTGSPDGDQIEAQRRDVLRLLEIISPHTAGAADDITAVVPFLPPVARE